MTTEAPKPDKVTIQLQAVGDAPILKIKKINVDSTHDVAYLLTQVRKMLSLTPDASLYFFCSQTFAPSPGHSLQLLRDCYATRSADGKCVLHLQYSTTPAWG